MLRHATDCIFFVTANGCPQTAQAFRDIARQHPNVHVTENATNEGFQKPHNLQFIEAAKADCQYCLIANDDIDVPAHFLDTLARPMDNDPGVAITGPEGNCTHLDAQFHGAGSNGGEPEYIEMSCGLIRIAAIRALRTHLWCPDLRFCYGEDSSLSLFVREKGYSIRIAPLHVGHLRSVTVNGDPQTKRLCDEAQKDNHAVNRSRWSYYLKHRRFDFPIVVRRSYAIGDALLITPIIRAIAKSNPLSPIHVQTDTPELFARNPYVTRAGKVESHMPSDALFIDLDLSYENQPMTHIVKAYENTVRQHLPGLAPVELRTEMYPSKADQEWARKMRDSLAGTKKLALIGSDPTNWPAKNLSPDKFAEIRLWLEKKGWKTVAVGSKKAEIQTTLMQLPALAAVSQLFVGNDSYPLHAAQAGGCPTVGVFGCTLPRMILTQTSKAASASADPSIPCAGGRHRVRGQTFVPCDPACINSVTVEAVCSAIERLEVL